MNLDTRLAVLWGEKQGSKEKYCYYWYACLYEFIVKSHSKCFKFLLISYVTFI